MAYVEKKQIANYSEICCRLYKLVPYKIIVCFCAAPEGSKENRRQAIRFDTALFVCILRYTLITHHQQQTKHLEAVYNAWCVFSS